MWAGGLAKAPQPIADKTSESWPWSRPMRKMVRIFSSVIFASSGYISPSIPIRGPLSAATEMTGILYNFSSYCDPVDSGPRKNETMPL